VKPFPLPCLLLYTAVALAANPAAAQVLTPEQREAVEALREGEMRKLTVHEAPVPGSDAVFTDRDGGEHRLSDGDGAVRLVNFWATWCAPCRQEKPSLDALNAERASPDFGVIAIASGRNSLEAIDRFNEEVGIVTLDTYLDPRTALAGEMRVPGLPVTVVLNRDGDEIARLMGGADWNGESARAIVAYLTNLAP
jgi:thiol-disulfide isomerase/thioredoxin